MSLEELKTGKHVCDVKFIRLYVKNTGLSTIKDCCGYITKLTKRTETEEEGVPKQQEIIDLGWSHYPQSTARAIPRGAFFHMDVVSLYLTVERELRPPHLPNTLKKFFRGKGSYKVWILIAADNAKPREIVVEFTCDPEHDELTPKEGNWECYPWWESRLDRLRSWWGKYRPPMTWLGSP